MNKVEFCYKCKCEIAKKEEIGYKYSFGDVICKSCVVITNFINSF